MAELWRTLRTGHVVLTAPRRTGKTSVMDYLRDHPENGFSVVSINVQDLAHPADSSRCCSMGSMTHIRISCATSLPQVGGSSVAFWE